MGRTARAPEPDQARRVLKNDPLSYPYDELADDEDVTLRVEWDGRIYELAQSDIGPADDMMCRAQTADFTKGKGFTVTGMMGTFATGNMAEAGLDAFAVIIWACQRKAGNHELTISKVMETLPGYKQLLRELKIEVLTSTAEDDAPGGDSPEGSLTTSGPASRNGSASTSKTSTGRRSKAASRTDS